MKWFVKLFEIDERMESFKIPAIKIGACVLILLGVSIFGICVDIPPSALSVVLTVLSVAIMIITTLCMFTAMAQCLQVSQNIKNRRK